LKPDVIVTALPADRLDDRIRAGDPGAITYPSLYDLFGHPEFRELYAGGLVRLPASLDHHGIYVRRDSTAALPAEDWREGPPGIPPAEPPARD
jgi:hypothetical protein